MATGTLEDRLSALEVELAEIKMRLNKGVAPPNPWLDKIFGAFKDDPLFEEAARYGREWRESQRTEYDEDQHVSA